MSTETPTVLDTCPVCGKKDIVAVCEVVVEYTVENCGRNDRQQDWERGDIDDDTSQPKYFRCDGCDTEFYEFQMEGGFLVGLTVPEPEEPKPISEAEFRAWLTERVTRFADWNDGDIDDESLDCGDMWRQMEDGGELDEIGVRCVRDYAEQTMYFSGMDASGERWIIGSAYELGIEGETVWLNPLCNLQWGPSLVQTLTQAAARMRQRATELESLLTV